MGFTSTFSRSNLLLTRSDNSWLRFISRIVDCFLTLFTPVIICGKLFTLIEYQGVKEFHMFVLVAIVKLWFSTY